MQSRVRLAFCPAAAWVCNPCNATTTSLISPPPPPHTHTHSPKMGGPNFPTSCPVDWQKDEDLTSCWGLDRHCQSAAPTCNHSIEMLERTMDADCLVA